MPTLEGITKFLSNSLRKAVLPAVATAGILGCNSAGYREITDLDVPIHAEYMKSESGKTAKETAEYILDTTPIPAPQAQSEEFKALVNKECPIASPAGKAYIAIEKINQAFPQAERDMKDLVLAIASQDTNNETLGKYGGNIKTLTSKVSDFSKLFADVEAAGTQALVDKLAMSPELESFIGNYEAALNRTRQLAPAILDVAYLEARIDTMNAGLDLMLNEHKARTGEDLIARGEKVYNSISNLKIREIASPESDVFDDYADKTIAEVVNENMVAIDKELNGTYVIGLKVNGKNDETMHVVYNKLVPYILECLKERYAHIVPDKMSQEDCEAVNLYLNKKVLDRFSTTNLEELDPSTLQTIAAVVFSFIPGTNVYHLFESAPAALSQEKLSPGDVK